MQGLMQDHPLTLPHLFDRAEQLFPDKEIVTATATGRERTHLRRVGRAHPPPRRRARRPRHLAPTAGWPPSPGTPPATSSCTSPRRARGRVLHTLNIRLFPEQLTYIVNHAEDEVIFVDRSLLGLLWPLLDTFETVRHIVVMDDGRARCPSPDGGRPELHDYEDLLAAADARRVARRRREPGRVDVLHERHHGQPQGRRLQPPLDLPAHHGAHAADSLGARESRPHPAGRADVPRQRLGPGPRRGGRPAPTWSCPGPTCRRPRSPTLIEEREGHRRRRRAHHLDGRAARAEGPRHLGAAGHPVRRLGRAQGAVGGATASRSACRSSRPGA